MASFFKEMSEEIALHFVTTIRYRTITGPMDNQILQDDLNGLKCSIEVGKGLANVI